MTGIAISIDWLHVIPCHSSAYHPARPRLARPHPVLWRHPLEGVRVAEYPTPEAVVRRCVAGLTAAREKPKGGAPTDVPDETGKPPLIHGIRVRWEFQPQIWA